MLYVSYNLVDLLLPHKSKPHDLASFVHVMLPIHHFQKTHDPLPPHHGGAPHKCTLLHKSKCSRKRPMTWEYQTINHDDEITFFYTLKILHLSALSMKNHSGSNSNYFCFLFFILVFIFLLFLGSNFLFSLVCQYFVKT
jgi:hypothetical protein